MKYLFCSVVVSLLLVGCSDDGNDDDDDSVAISLAEDIADDDSIASPLPDISSEEFIDSNFSLRYPSSWLVNPNGQVPGVDAQFFSPQTNEFGGNDNCGVSYTFEPSLSLIDLLDEVSVLFDSSPEPTEEFLEVNGVPAGKITGTVTAANIRIPSVAQVMALDGQLIFGFCVGSNDEAIELILGSLSLN